MAGLNATHLLTLYTSCGGLRPGGAHLAAACEGPAPSAAVVSAPPPSPGPRRKHPAHEAPPPPPSTEKPSPPPQQHDGAAHSKAVPAYAVLPAAAAATVRPQPVALCQPTSIATQVALFCTPDTPTAQCCEPVVAAMDLGGGVPCLCRVAAEPQLIMAGLNATHLLTLYTSCGGLRPGGAHLAAACEGNAPPAAVISALPPSAGPRRKQPPAGVSVRLSIAQKQPCDFPGLASYIDDNCGETAPNASCCMAVVAAVDIKNCFCKVIMEEPMLTGPIGGRHIIFLYNACGGIRALSNEEVLACDSPAKAYSKPISQESSLAVGIETNDTSLQKDIYYVTKLNTVLLAAVAILFSMQAFLLCIMYFKAVRVGRRDTSTRNNGGQPHYQYELHRTKGDPRLVQSDGGRGSFSSLGMFTPYSRLDHRAD